MTSGAALQMRFRLASLMREYCVECNPVSIPLSPPTDHPMMLEGYASTTDKDLDRVRLRPYAFGWPLLFRRGLPPLLFKHDCPAGRIDSLAYDDGGNLKIRATVTHPLARRMGAFSIGARVLAYEMRDADGPEFWARIDAAELTEVSITDRPANPRAVVTHRYPASARVQFYTLMTEKVECLTKLAQLIGDNR